MAVVPIYQFRLFIIVTEVLPEGVHPLKLKDCGQMWIPKLVVSGVRINCQNLSVLYYCNSDRISLLIRNTGWPKSCDPNVQAYCGHIIHAMNLNHPEMPSLHQPYEDFTKITHELVHLLFNFVHFRLFRQILTNCYF